MSDSSQLHGLYSLWNSPGQNTGVVSLSLFQGIFPTQGWNTGLPYCRQILYQLSNKWSPRILEWVAYPLFSRSSWPRNRTRVSCIAGRFFTNWAIGGKKCQITRKETKRSNDQRATNKNKNKQTKQKRSNNLAISTYLWIFTLNINGINVPIKRHRVKG